MCTVCEPEHRPGLTEARNTARPSRAYCGQANLPASPVLDAAGPGLQSRSSVRWHSVALPSLPCQCTCQTPGARVSQPSFISLSEGRERRRYSRVHSALHRDSPPGRVQTPRSPSPSPSPICPGTGTGPPSPICPGAGSVARSRPRVGGAAHGATPPSPSPICRGRGHSPVPRDSHRGVCTLPPNCTK